MKKICFIILSLLSTSGILAQSGKEANPAAETNAGQSRFDNRKEKGFYNIMQVGLLFGSNQIIERIPDYSLYNIYSSSYIATPMLYYYPNSRNILTVAPSFTITNGYRFNKHWAAGAGIGYEVFAYNLYPLFAEVRYTLWDNKISPFFAIKGGYSFGGLKAKHYDQLYLDWPPYSIDSAELRHNGGFMVHPEIGVKVPLNENCDLLFSAAYRYQKIKSVARKKYDAGQFDEWDHYENISRLVFSIAIMFR